MLRTRALSAAVNTAQLTLWPAVLNEPDISVISPEVVRSDASVQLPPSIIMLVFSLLGKFIVLFPAPDSTNAPRNLPKSTLASTFIEPLTVKSFLPDNAKLASVAVKLPTCTASLNDTVLRAPLNEFSSNTTLIPDSGTVAPGSPPDVVDQWLSSVQLPLPPTQNLDS